MPTWNPLDKTQQRAELQRQIQAAQNGGRGVWGIGGAPAGTVSPFDDGGAGRANQVSALQQQLAEMNPQPGGASAVPQNAQDATAQALGWTAGRGQATLDDPYIQAVLDRLKTIESGQDAPFSAQVQDQMLARRGDASAAAEGSQADELRTAAAARGIGPNDPSLQAQLRQLTSERQQGNNANLGDIQTQARLTNFDAQNQAGSSLAQLRLNQLGHADNQFNQAAAMDANWQDAGPHVPGFQYQPNPINLPPAQSQPTYQFGQTQPPSTVGAPSSGRGQDSSWYGLGIGADLGNAPESNAEQPWSPPITGAPSPFAGSTTVSTPSPGYGEEGGPLGPPSPSGLFSNATTSSMRQKVPKPKYAFGQAPV